MNKRMKLGLIIGIAAVIVITGLILLIIFMPSGNTGDNDIVPIEFNSLESTVDEDGVRTVNVPVNEKGETKDNVTGTLIDLLPADLNKVTVENSSGNYVFGVTTNSDGATTYVLEGFEDYNLNNTNAAMIGSAISHLEMVAVIDATGELKADYGLDKPQVTATALFNDGTTFKLYIGDTAPTGVYTYVSVEGCDSVFSVASEDISALLLNINDMFNPLIRSEYSTVSDEDFTYITLGGTHLEEQVTLKHAEDGSLNAYYVLSSHNDMPVNSTAGSNIIGTIKSITAESVAFANPDADTLKSLGLDNPYATVEAEYVYEQTDAETEEKAEKTLLISMLCSEPDAEGKVYLMDKGGNLVYKISTDSVKWSTVSMSDLRSEYVFAPSYSAIDTLTVSNGSESYTFTVETVVTEGVDAETGEETSTSEIVVKYGDKKVEESYLRILFDDFAYIPVRGEATAADKGSDTVCAVTYGYSTERADDTVTFYATDSQKVIPEVNGGVDCYIYKSDVEGLLANAKALSEGKEITAVSR